jgi:demethylspheroidene O-methyltransferase
VSWPEGWRRLRDRWLASERFQDVASRSVLTGFAARRSARALFDLCAGFVYSQVLFAVVELGLLEALRDGPSAPEALATRLGMPPERAQRLFDAALALRLLQRRDAGDIGLGALGATLLGNPAVVAMIRHHRLLYADLADPVALLRAPPTRTALGEYWAYAREPDASGLDPTRTDAYSTLMATSQALIAGQVLDAYPLRRHRSLLDVGGGFGAFALAALQRAPQLHCRVFDLPAVAARTQARFEAAGCAERATALGGDFLTDPLPGGADVISLVRVLHDHDDASVHRILRAAREALGPGGTLLIAEPMPDGGDTQRVGDAYFGFYLLAMGQGRARSPERLAAMLREAGFRAPRRRRTQVPLQCQVLVTQVER